MSLTIMKLLPILGIIGHIINMYCDRILCVFPKGKLTLTELKDIEKNNTMANLMEGVSADIPMRSAILETFALVLQFLGYLSITAYTYEYSKIYGSIMFLMIVFFCIIGTAHHMKYCLCEYVFLKLNRNDTAKSLMMQIFNSAPITKLCYVTYIGFVITLIIAIVTGTIGFPIWTVIFTILPIFILLFPFRIIGTLHISAIISMLAWIILI